MRFHGLAIAGLSLAQLSSTAALVVSEGAQIARGRLFEALGSPSGKLTLSPELVIPDPRDPTAILLQSTAISSVSGQIRSQAKPNSAWISGTVSALKTFCYEQEQARGNFPGPIPVIYCDDEGDDILSIADAGAAGILVRVSGGKEVSSLDDLASDASWAETCKSALECGLQPIPEVTIGDATAESWKEDDIIALVGKITEMLSGQEPLAVLLTINPDDDEKVSLPQVPKALGKRVPIIGSIRVKPAENIFSEETARFKKAGFTGALLRAQCVPGYEMNPKLEFLGNFWCACIGELKSVKSKNFAFRSTNDMAGNTVATQWSNYQQDVMDSGALGLMKDSFDPDLETGEYKGF
jgi:hypothetical protein